MKLSKSLSSSRIISIISVDGPAANQQQLLLQRGYTTSTYEQICAALLAFLSAFVYNNPSNKTSVLTSREAHISNSTGSSTSGVLHYLLANALSSSSSDTASQPPVVIRTMYFQLLVSCLNNNITGPQVTSVQVSAFAKQKSAMCTVLTKHIESIVQSGIIHDLPSVRCSLRKTVFNTALACSL